MLLKHQSGSLLVFHNLVLQVLDLEVSLVDLFGHLKDVQAGLLLVPLKVLNVLLGHFQLFFLGLDQLVSVAVLGVALLDLVFLGQDRGRYALMDLAEQRVEGVVSGVDL